MKQFHVEDIVIFMHLVARTLLAIGTMRAVLVVGRTLEPYFLGSGLEFRLAYMFIALGMVIYVPVSAFRVAELFALKSAKESKPSE